MKKKTAVLLAAALAVSLALCACGVKNGPIGGASSESGGGENFTGLPSEPSFGGSDSFGGIDGEAPSSDSPSEDDWSGVLDGVSDAIEPQTSLAEKIIYSADVTIETVKFDEAVESVDAMLQKYGAFLEASSIDGKSYSDSYNGYQTYRQAAFTIRVPVSSFKDMTEDLENVGNVTNRRVYTENITARYYDTQSRVDSYRIEQERLLEMLEKCETVADMIEIESRLSQVRYELESLESTLRDWQNHVDYSTVNVTLNEVQEYTKQVEIHRTYWQQIGDGLKNTFENIGDFFKNLFKGIVVYLPAILLLGVFVLAVAAVVVAIRRGVARKSGKRRETGTETRGSDEKDENGEDGKK